MAAWKIFIIVRKFSAIFVWICLSVPKDLANRYGYSLQFSNPLILKRYTAIFWETTLAFLREIAPRNKLGIPQVPLEAFRGVAASIHK